jgi:RNA polymerase sigma factor (sigma-70 family)
MFIGTGSGVPAPLVRALTSRVSSVGDVKGSEDRVTDDEARRRFTEVVMPHLDSAFRLARWLTRNRDDAEDVVQDAYLKAFRAIGDFAGINSKAWLLTIVRRTAYSWLAKNRPRCLVLTDDIAKLELAKAEAVASLDDRCLDNPEARLLSSERTKQLRVAAEALALPLREALVLREFDGMTYREIADVLEVPVGTVMSRLARARNELLNTVERRRH